MMEIETPIARLRNKMQPIVTYFQLRKMLEDGGELEERHRPRIQELCDETYRHIQSGSLDTMLEILKNDALWRETQNLT
jgi:hypothetical protein